MQFPQLRVVWRNLKSDSEGAAKSTSGPKRNLSSWLPLSLSGILLVALISSAQAGIYKWTDGDGKVHYTSSPPPAGSAPANIDTDTFSTVKTHKARPVSVKKKPTKTRTTKRRTRVRRQCPRR